MYIQIIISFNGSQLSKAYRTLSQDQSCQIWICDIVTNECKLLFESSERLLEAPNWTNQGDELIVNGDGLLWRFKIDAPDLVPINIDGLPPVNNDHVLDPDGKHIFISTNQNWQIYRAPLSGGTAVQVTGKVGPPELRYFLHGVSPDGNDLTFVGVQAEPSEDGDKFVSAEIYVTNADGNELKQLTHSGAPADGPEYSPDGEWIYFNTEVFSGHAQIARMRPDGSELERLTYAKTADWFPHISPDGNSVLYLSFPERTSGYPADKWVELMLVDINDWKNPRSVVKLFGGQGTINVSGWSPGSRYFAYVAYPAGRATV